MAEGTKDDQIVMQLGFDPMQADEYTRAIDPIQPAATDGRSIQ